MAKLETQYENYLKELPTSNNTFDEWLIEVWEPDMEDISDWDVTLEDGLDDIEE
jgi:hypothetical protein